ncbi:AraC-like DNA-binding protein [Bradyrhizobium sp. AZCC 2262]|uniref:AraC-like ligand-binding domain-containing protein n=1 Tax=Bradyrhizobium sp. AZCC 2262 TaxID=3117022 RepID=UPI002FEE8AF7
MLAEKIPINVKRGDSFDHWHEVTCRNYSVTECRPVSIKHFCAHISVWRFGALVISDLSCSTAVDNLITITRTPAHLRRDCRDDFQLWLITAGSAVFAQGGLEARMQPGDLVLQDQARPFALEFGPRHDAILITIPRPLMISRLPAASKFVARRISGDTNLGKLSAAIIRQSIALGDTSDEVAGRVGSSALDILATTIEVQLAERTDDTTAQTRRLAQVQRFVRANLHNPKLDLDTIAKIQKMSTRTLNRLFASEGTTPIRWLWQQRLAASFNALAEGHVSYVTDAALNFGFSDCAHFSRAFKAAYGQSPQTLIRGRIHPPSGFAGIASDPRR